MTESGRGGGADAFDAWFLPGQEPGAIETLEAGGLVCRYPVPDADLIGRVAVDLRQAGDALRRRPVGDIMDVVDAAAARLADPTAPLRREAERGLNAATGYSPEMTRLVLDRMAADWRTGALDQLLDAELPDRRVLDGFQEVRPGRSTRAYGPRLAFHVFAGNVPGVAVTSLVRALLVKAPSLGKLASGQPVLPVIFARAVEAVDPEVARALAVTYWPGDPAGEAVGAVEKRALEEADTVVVYGGEGATESFRRRGRPGQRQRLVVHGPRFSVGLVAREAAAVPEAVADDVARAVAAFDQHGCVSPHTIWVEGDDTEGMGVARALARALDALESELPRGRLVTAEAARIQQERATAELKSHSADGAAQVFADAGTAWTVVYDPDPTFRPSCLNRFIRVHPVPELEAVYHLLAPHRARLQSVAIAGDPHRRRALAEGLARVGTTRVTTFRRLPWPPPDWHHDGQPPLGELLRWVDLEE